MLKLIKGDITELNSEVIVNAANSELAKGHGVCGAIFEKAGDDLVKYCNRFRLFTKDNETIRCKTGDAVITPAFRLSVINPAIKYIIHAVGPIYNDGKHNEATLLATAYIKSVEIAVSCGVKSIAFPFISSGIYGYPIDECADVAMTTLRNLAATYPIEITMCAFSDTDLHTLCEIPINNFTSPLIV